MRALASFVAASMLFGLIGFVSIPQAKAAGAGDLISCPDFNSIYYLADDNTRWVFPNEKTYFTWYEDFDDVVEITCEELASYSIGQIVTYQPGTRLVKIQSINKVYAIEPGGVLRWITSETHANDLYGFDWASRIDDVPDGFWSSYTEGNALALGEYPIGTIISNADVSIYGQHYDAFYRVDSDDLFDRVYEVFLNPVLNSFVIELSDDEVESFVDAEQKALSEIEFDEVVKIEAEVFIEELTEEEELELSEAEVECSGEYDCFVQSVEICESNSLAHVYASEGAPYLYSDTMYLLTEANQDGTCTFHIEYVSTSADIMDEYYDSTLEALGGDVDLLNQGVEATRQGHANSLDEISLDYEFGNDGLVELQSLLINWDENEIDFGALNELADWALVPFEYNP